MKLPDGFVYHRPVPREWQEDLSRLTPKADRTTWLQLAWLSGDPWGPVQRWAVYEMVPLEVWGEIIRGHRAKGHQECDIWECVILEALQGENPRDLGHYDTVLGRFISDSLVTRDEWELFREHHAIPKLYWIIQGEQGGHKRHFSGNEQKYLKLANLPSDPPSPGSLPYAPYDRRVFDQLARRDRLQALKGTLTEAHQEQEFRRHLVSWLRPQMGAVLESAKINLDGIPRTSHDPTAEMERGIANYVETGSTHGATHGD